MHRDVPSQGVLLIHRSYVVCLSSAQAMIDVFPSFGKTAPRNTCQRSGWLWIFALGRRTCTRHQADFTRACSNQQHVRGVYSFWSIECSRCESDTPGPPTWKEQHLSFWFPTCVSYLLFWEAAPQSIRWFDKSFGRAELRRIVMEEYESDFGARRRQRPTSS